MWIAMCVYTTKKHLEEIFPACGLSSQELYIKKLHFAALSRSSVSSKPLLQETIPDSNSIIH